MHRHALTLTIACATAARLEAQQPPAPPHDAHGPGFIACPELTGDVADGSALRGRPCAIIARRPVAARPSDALVWTIDAFGTVAAARAAATEPTDVVVTVGDTVWLLGVGTSRPPRAGARRAGTVRLPPVPRASGYAMVLAYYAVRPGSHSAAHTHAGPEAWFLLNGSQCLETPDGVHRASAGEGMALPADVPMHLTVTGTGERRGFFLVVHDSARAWNTEIAWRPSGRCGDGAGAPAAASDSATEMGAIRAVLDRFYDGWNTHDVEQMVSAYADDVDHVNVFAEWHRGKAEIAEDLRRFHAGPARNSRKTYTIEKLRFVKPDVAVVHVRSLSTVGNLGTYVMTKQSGRWLTVSFTNVGYDLDPSAPRTGVTRKP